MMYADDMTHMGAGAWIILFGCVFVVAFPVGMWLVARARENRLIREGHEDQAYVNMFGVNVRRSTVTAVAASAVVAHGGGIHPLAGVPHNVPDPTNLREQLYGIKDTA